MQTIQQVNTITETELIARVRAGETALFEILIRKNNSFLYKVGMSYGYKHEDVEDLMQETFIAAYQHLDKFEGRSSFKTWITRIMLNSCYQRKMKPAFTSEKTICMLEKAQSADTYKNIFNKELNHVISNALIEIPLEYRMVFSLRELNGMKTAETAELLNISETNVKVRLNRARNMLRKKLEAMYSTEDIFEFNLIYCDRIVNKVMKAISELN